MKYLISLWLIAILTMFSIRPIFDYLQIVEKSVILLCVLTMAIVFRLSDE